VGLLPPAVRTLRRDPIEAQHGGAISFGVAAVLESLGTRIEHLNGARVAQMSDTLPIDLNSAALGIGRHVSGIADPFNGHIDAFRIAHVQR
jgi:hypothetical protein